MVVEGKYVNPNSETTELNATCDIRVVCGTTTTDVCTELEMAVEICPEDGSQVAPNTAHKMHQKRGFPEQACRNEYSRAQSCWALRVQVEISA